MSLPAPPSDDADLTLFMWEIQRLMQTRLQLRVFTVPGLVPDLMKALQDRGIRSHKVSNHSLVLTRPECVNDFVNFVYCPLVLRNAVAEYASACKEQKLGQTVDPDVRRRQLEAMNKVLALIPKRNYDKRRGQEPF